MRQSNVQVAESIGTLAGNISGTLIAFLLKPAIIFSFALVVLKLVGVADRLSWWATLAPFGVLVGVFLSCFAITIVAGLAIASFRKDGGRS